jgi:hypothetical protein
MADLAELRQRLEAIGEDLANAAMDALRQAIDAGETARPELERRITRARRAVERAIVALGDDRARADEPGFDEPRFDEPRLDER